MDNKLIVTRLFIIESAGPLEKVINSLSQIIRASDLFVSSKMVLFPYYRSMDPANKHLSDHCYEVPHQCRQANIRPVSGVDKVVWHQQPNRTPRMAN
jgi:hypothetical protein